jgi:hypothetical protein
MEKKREMRWRSSSITLAQDMVWRKSEERVLFILGETKLPLLDQCQVSTTKHKRESQGGGRNSRVLARANEWEVSCMRWG